MKLKKRTMTAVAIACLTAFAANAQASPRAVTVPNNAKSTVATAAANHFFKKRYKAQFSG